MSRRSSRSHSARRIAHSILPLPSLKYGDVSAEHDSEPMRVGKNTDVILAGKQYKNLFMSLDGWLARYKTLRNGSRQIMDFILPGQIFGMQACLFNCALYSVGTITDVTISTISIEGVDNVFERNATFAKSLFWSAVCESAIMTEHLINAARRSAYARISHLLLELYVRMKAAGLVEDMSFEIPLTQEHIGNALGLTNVHVNRTLRALRDDKLIAVEGKRITILDFDALVQLSEFDHSYLGLSARAIRGERSTETPNRLPQFAI